jgi:NrS-1  polymerase HBD domain
VSSQDVTEGTAGSDLVVPLALRERPQWVVWRLEERDGKPTKVPYVARPPLNRASSGTRKRWPASATDSATWRTYLEAVELAKDDGFDGIGFVVSADDEFCGVDLDDCDESGVLHPEAGAILLRLDSYAEFSPSGRGVRVFVQAKKNTDRCRTSETRWGGKLEIYDRGRFFTVTGNHVRGTPVTVEPRQAELDEIIARFLPAPTSLNGPQPFAVPVDLDDIEILERARSAKNGGKFDRLFAGDLSDYGSPSEGDIALCSMLAFWTGPDPVRIDRLFRQSRLMRAKWDRGDGDYRNRTIAAALSGRSEFYSATSPHLAPTSPPRSFVHHLAPRPLPKGGEVVGDLAPHLAPTSPPGTTNWTPLDVVALGATPPKPPEIAGLFYVGKRHNLAGESEALKSWLLLAAAVAELRDGRGVVWVDGDLVGPSDLLERLRSLGVGDDTIREAFLYFVPESPLRDSADLVGPLSERGGRLAVLDGFNPLLFLHGCDPDKGVGIEAFMRAVANPLRDAGAAVVLADNVAKAREARGSWAIGSERKKSAVEVQIGMSIVEPFGRGRVGKSKLTVHKDRPGYLERPSPGLFVLSSDVDSGRVSWRIEPDHSVGEDGEFRPTHLMEKVSRYLELRAPEPCSRRQIEEDVTGKRDALRAAIDQLVAEGFAVEFPGERGARLVKSEKAYRETDEWDA